MCDDDVPCQAGDMKSFYHCGGLIREFSGLDESCSTKKTSSDIVSKVLAITKPDVVA